MSIKTCQTPPFSISEEQELALKDPNEFLDKETKQIKDWFNSQKIDSFYKQIVAPNFYAGADALIQSAGLGSLKPNTLLLGFKSDWQEESQADNVKHYGGGGEHFLGKFLL